MTPTASTHTIGRSLDHYGLGCQDKVCCRLNEPVAPCQQDRCAKTQSMNNVLTDSSRLMRRMDSASSPATLNGRIRSQAFDPSRKQIVSVTTSSSNADDSMFATAFPDRTAWVAYATTFPAPSPFS